jgi:hypothetical protein
MWEGFQDDYNFFTLLLNDAGKHMIPSKSVKGYSETTLGNKTPDLIFFGPFGSVWKQYPNIPKVHFTGENTPRIEHIDVKLNLGFQYFNMVTKNYLRFPLWFTEINWFGADVDRLVNLDANKTAEIWIQQGDSYIYNNSTFTLPPEIWAASIQTFRTIKVTLSKANATAGPGFSITGTDAPAIEKVEKVKDNNNGTSSSNKQWLITTATDIPIGSNLTLVHQDADPARTFGSRLINPAAIFSSPEFVNAYTYEGNDLGATYDSTKTDFRVWAPTASAVSLVIYANADSTPLSAQVIPMFKSVKGTWTHSLSGDRHLQVYMYRVTVGGNTEEAVDPYARSVTANGVRGVVIDLSKTNPAGFLTQAKPAFSGKAADSVMYELHVRDASIEASSGVKALSRGGKKRKYPAYSGVKSPIPKINVRSDRF